MSYLLFLDESGHFGKQTPYEVYGGIAVHASRLWALIQRVQQLEIEYFGGPLREFGMEIKGDRLLNRKRFRFASQDKDLPDDIRRKHCRAFLHDTHEGREATRIGYTAYGQTCLQFSTALFQCLVQHDVKLFASAIKASRAPDDYLASSHLRKDHVFLFERYFYLLDELNEYGLLVMDETEKVADLKLVRRVERYFQATERGRFRSSRIVPVPLFVSSDMAYPIQIADLCIYCVNWGFRLPALGMDLPTRQEVAEIAGHWLRRLQYMGQIARNEEVFDSYGIVFVPNPYGPGRTVEEQ